MKLTDYLNWKEGQASAPPFYNMSSKDGHYAFSSGVRTQIASKLVDDINASIKSIMKSKKAILPPPIGGKLLKQKTSKTKSPFFFLRDTFKKSKKSKRIGDKAKKSRENKIYRS